MSSGSSARTPPPPRARDGRSPIERYAVARLRAEVSRKIRRRSLFKDKFPPPDHVSVHSGSSVAWVSGEVKRVQPQFR